MSHVMWGVSYPATNVGSRGQTCSSRSRKTVPVLLSPCSALVATALATAPCSARAVAVSTVTPCEASAVTVSDSGTYSANTACWLHDNLRTRGTSVR
ncbi:hypothetical protein PoB_005902100 [Plakobranchus ocellatus]|uniref:Secreted protein n=1 Tax=Plakobranchus ocellatus TaxID=259542 RepID=A0AAV4CB33_9GAST|nr:hypothetical protein PoB_005902100 [Plakobranchus ocellatus]